MFLIFFPLQVTYFKFGGVSLVGRLSSFNHVECQPTLAWHVVLHTRGPRASSHSKSTASAPDGVASCGPCLAGCIRSSPQERGMLLMASRGPCHVVAHVWCCSAYLASTTSSNVCPLHAAYAYLLNSCICATDGKQRLQPTFRGLIGQCHLHCDSACWGRQGDKKQQP